MARYSLIAGFVAGFTYYLKPSLPFNVMAFTTVLQLLIYRYWQSNVKDCIKSIPFMELWTAMMTGILMHHRMLHTDICSKSLMKIMDLLTNKHLTYIHTNIINFAANKIILTNC